MKLKQNILILGLMVSSDQFESAVRGRLPHTYGRDKNEDKFCGGTIFCDHATTFIYINCQVSLRTGETIHIKSCLKIWQDSMVIK